MKNKPSIPIFFLAENQDVSFLTIAIRSLIENSSKDYRYLIHILNNGISARRADEIAKMQREDAEIRFVDIGHAVAPISERLNLRDGHTALNWVRLFLASIFPQYHKAICLDPDVIVNEDIAQLYQIPLGAHYVGAVADEGIAGRRELSSYVTEAVGVPSDRYFSSAVLLMNLDAFRMERIEEKFVYLLENYRFDTLYPDQDYLNVLCRDHVLYLDKIWNQVSEKASRKGSSALIYRPLCRVPIPCERTAYGALFRQYAVGTPIESELHQLQKHAGFCAYLARKRERRFLRGEIRRICQQKTNFRLVLEETPIDRMPWRQRKARHA